MEEKLLELKEQFCKWYCEGKDIHELCNYCQVDDYIKHIRDELNK